uniref:hypothetical protein n=1 Tax=Lachnoclostridium phocaeense TaxID=1871021 RepID=UPI0026DCBD1A|nr:hypothetical protein [Lachnoclostridium phocaeense]
MKKYKVSRELKPYIRRILVRSFYKCKLILDPAGQYWCYTNANSDTFHRIVQRAKCEKKTSETGLLQFTAKEANNALFRSAMMDLTKESAYQVIDDVSGARTALKTH